MGNATPLKLIFLSTFLFISLSWLVFWLVDLMTISGWASNFFLNLIHISVTLSISLLFWASKILSGRFSSKICFEWWKNCSKCSVLIVLSLKFSFATDLGKIWLKMVLVSNNSSESKSVHKNYLISVCDWSKEV